MISLSTSFLFFGIVGEVAYKEVFSFFDAKHNWNGSNSRIHVLHFFLSSSFIVFLVCLLKAPPSNPLSCSLLPLVSSQESL